jgi:hypothetical protein
VWCANIRLGFERVGFRDSRHGRTVRQHPVGSGKPIPPLERRCSTVPESKVHLDDGRNFLLAQSKQYDQITIELTSIQFAGATNLYSPEFYELARTISG